jgi:uracil phosphoribosyltransferase
LKYIKVLSILMSDFALKKIHHFHPDVQILTLSVEKEINEHGYLVPGLGDAGDRLYQTK